MQQAFNLGEILLVEYPEGYYSLIFIDTPFNSESVSVSYTQIAHKEDYGEGLEVYTGLEAGSIPFDKITRKATDEDLELFIDTVLKSNDEPQKILSEWVEVVGKDNVLVESEKNRLSALVKTSLASLNL